MHHRPYFSSSPLSYPHLSPFQAFALSYSASDTPNTGIVYKNAGNHSAALSAYNESLSIRKAVFGEVHSEVANTLINIGLVHLSERQFMEASKSFQRAFDIRVSVFGRNQ